MNDYTEPDKRRAGDYLLFAIAFISFWITGCGIILSSPPVAFTGATMLLLAVLCFLPRRPPGE